MDTCTPAPFKGSFTLVPLVTNPPSVVLRGFTLQKVVACLCVAVLGFPRWHAVIAMSAECHTDPQILYGNILFLIGIFLLPPWNILAHRNKFVKSLANIAKRN